ncbi:unnamed protein product [Lampetra planeri]
MESGALTSQTPHGTPEPNGDGSSPKPGGLTPLPTGKRPSIVGEDDGGGAEAKLFGKGLAATSLLQIAIRNGIYQNQVANAIGGAAKNINMPVVKTVNSGSTSVNSLLGKRRQRHRRNLSLGAPPTGSSPAPAAAEAAGAAPSASPLSTLSLDRKTFLRQKQSKQLQAADRSWVRSDLRRGCVHVHDWLTPSYPRPVLCMVDTSAGEVVGKLEGSKAGAVLRVACPGPTEAGSSVGVETENLQQHSSIKKHQNAKMSNSFLSDNTPSNSSSEIHLNDIGVDLSLSGAYSGANEGPDPFESSSDEVDLTSSPTHSTSAVDLLTSTDPPSVPDTPEDDQEVGADSPRPIKPPSKCSSSSQSRPLTSQASVQPELEIPEVGGRGWAEPISPTPALFVQLHGGAVRRLGEYERPLQILNDYLTSLGFEDPCRSLEELPAQLFYSQDLTHLNLKNNFMSPLKGIPSLTRFCKLRSLSLSNNALFDFPLAVCDITSLTELNLSGNRLSSLPADVGAMQQLNRLQQVIVGDAQQLIHIVHLDLRDTGLQELDVMSLCRLELLRCDRNQLSLLRVGGHTLKSLHAAHNRTDALMLITVLLFAAQPENKLSGVPDWACESSRLEVLDISHNGITELPVRLLSNGSLRKLLAGWNTVCRLAERLERSQLEVLDLQHNHLTELPHNLFIKAQSLRYLNVSANKLENLPAASQSEDMFSSVQELYATNNSLTDKCVPLLMGHAHLRVLHLAFNQLQTFTARVNSCSFCRFDHREDLTVSSSSSVNWLVWSSWRSWT